MASSAQRRRETWDRLSTVAALVLAVCLLVATLVVMSGNLPPVFNQGMRAYATINVGLVLGLSTVLAVLSANVTLGFFPQVVKCVKLVGVWALTIELLLAAFDTRVVSVKGSPLGHGLYNAQAYEEELMLPQPSPLSPFGFRVAHADPVAYDGYRILFLGNSYVQGSGSDLTTNYPQVVEARLRGALPAKNISVMSAGVDGYGLRDEKVLYEYLSKSGYKIDAVVLNVMMQSDLTNNIPGMIRRAVAGEPQRFHENAYLRYFYPLNSYLARYALYFSVVFGRSWEPSSANAVGDARCRPSPAFAAFIKERTGYYYGPDARRGVWVDYNLAQAEAIIDMAKQQHIPVFVVLLPDPGAALDGYRQLQAGAAMDWDWTRNAVTSRLAPLAPVLDLAPAFRNQATWFRCDDSHWVDAGNVAGGEGVARWLAGQMAYEEHADQTPPKQAVRLSGRRNQ
jgi:hypothetical protein